MERRVEPRARVAVVEEHLLMRAAVREALQGAGFEVVGDYPDFNTFVNRLAADQASLAVIDGTARLLESSGLSELHQRHLDLQVVVFSGAGDARSIDRCYREGVAAFLDKRSATREDLVRTVEAVSKGERIFPMELLDNPLAPAPRSDEPTALKNVSIREREVLRYVASGADNLKIATLLQISERTVKAHISSLYRKLGAENRTQLALVALQLGVKPSTEPTERYVGPELAAAPSNGVP